MEVWENEKCCGNTSHRRVFPQLFRVLPNLHECFYNSIETRRKRFLFLLENSPRKITKNEENLIVLFIIKTYILYATQCTRHLNLNFFVFLSSYRNTIINQSARVFSLSYFLILHIRRIDPVISQFSVVRKRLSWYSVYLTIAKALLQKH